EDHREPRAADALTLTRVHLEQVDAVYEHLTTDRRSTRLHAEHRAQQRALPGSRLTEDAEHFATRHRERDVVHGAQPALVRLELGHEVPYNEQRAVEPWHGRDCATQPVLQQRHRIRPSAYRKCKRSCDPAQSAMHPWIGVVRLGTVKHAFRGVHTHILRTI